MSTICSLPEDPACFVLHSPGFPFGRRSHADSILFDSETRRETPHSSGLQLTLQPVMRISISNPLFNVIFWRPWNAVVPSPPAPPTMEPIPAPLPPPKMPPSSAPAPAPIAVCTALVLPRPPDWIAPSTSTFSPDGAP